MSYTYFVSYAYPQGFGNTHVRLNQPIDNMNTNYVEKQIADKKKFSNVVMLNYIRVPNKLVKEKS